MASMWSKSQSSNSMDMETQLAYSTGKCDSETLVYSKMEFNPNEVPHRLTTPQEPSSYRMEIHQKTQIYPPDYQTRMPLHAAEQPIGSNSDIQFYGTRTYRRILPKNPFVYPEITLDPRDVQKRQPPCEADSRSDSGRRHQGRSTKGIPSNQIDNTKNIYHDNTIGLRSLDPRDETPTRRPTHGPGLRPDLYLTHQSRQASSTNGNSSHQVDKPRDMHPDNIPSEKSREAQTRMPPDGVAIWSNSANVFQARQKRSTNEIPSNPIANIPRVTRLDPREVQTRMPSDGVDMWSNSANVRIQAHQKSSTNEIPSNPIANIPRVNCLDPREAQTRMPSDGVDMWSNSANVRIQAHQKSSTNEIPSNPIANIPRVTCLEPREVQTRMPSDGVAMWSNSTNVRNPTHQKRSTSEIPSNPTANIPRVTCLDPREVQTGMPPDRVAIWSNSGNVSQAHQASLSNGIPSNPIANIPGVTCLDRREPQTRRPPVKVGRQSDSDVSQYHQASSINGIPFYQMNNPREDNSDDSLEVTSLDSRDIERRMSLNGEGIPLCQTDLHEEVLLNPMHADVGNYEEINASNQTSSNRGTSLDQPRSQNTNGSWTCPRCHCLLETQPAQLRTPPVSSLNLENVPRARSSVIMIPLKQKKREERPLPAVQGQERTARKGTPTENGDSDSSSEDEGQEETEKRSFRVEISGKTARFKLTKEDWARMPIKSFPSGGRLLSGDWIRIFINKVKESNPWCSLRFKNNHVRSENSRKIHSAVFFRGAAECKYPECNMKMKFVIRKEYGKRVEVAYVGDVCHRDRTGKM